MRKLVFITTIGLGLAFTVLNPAWSASDGNKNSTGQMDHAAMSMKMNTEKKVVLPKEGGQAAFSTIAEIVVLLKNDPETDWSRVDINRLREHLVDMNELTLNVSVKTIIDTGHVSFSVSGEGRTVSAIQNMVPAHSAVLSDAKLYNAVAQKTENGTIMNVAFTNEQELAEITALGFFGLMASGSRHQAHHLQMARGNMPVNGN